VANTPQNTLTGPLAQVQKGFEELGQVLKGTFTQTLRDVKRLFDDLSDGKVIASVVSFGRALADLGKSFVAVAGTAAAAGTALGTFVTKANPAVFDQFTLAVRDLMAVVGRALVPLFQTVFIPVVRTAADVLMGLAPVGAALALVLKPLADLFAVVGEVVGRALGKVGEVLTAIAPTLAGVGAILAQLGNVVRPVLDLLIDIIGGAMVQAAKLLAGALQFVVPLMMALARVITDMVQFVTNGIRMLMAFFGVSLPDMPGFKPGESVGAATRSAQHMGVEDTIKQAQRAAFSLGTASKEDPMKAMAEAAKAMAERAEKIYTFITELPGKIWDYMKALPEMIWNFVKQLPELIWEKAKSLPKQVGDTIVPPGGWTDRNIKQPIEGALEDARDFYNRNAPDILPPKDRFTKPVYIGGININPIS
jgi:hypothetical protein